MQVNLEIKDKIVRDVVEKMVERSNAGVLKYGKTLSDEPVDEVKFLNLLQNEIMDAVLYIQACRDEISDLKSQHEANDMEVVQDESV